MVSDNRPPFWFMLIFLLVGLGTLGFGVREYCGERATTRGYVSAPARLVDYPAYEKDGDEVTVYSLIYEYSVEGRRYRVSADYGTPRVPERGTEKTIRYNPQNPAEAVVPGGSYVFLIVAGLIFAIFPFIMVLSGAKPSRLTEKMTTQERGVSVLFGVVALLMGGLLYHQLAGGMDLSLLGAIPLLCLGLGLFAVVAGVLNVRQSPASVGRVMRFFASVAEMAAGADEEKRVGPLDVLLNLGSLAVSLALLGLSVWILIGAADNVTRIASLPFFLCMIAVCGRILANLAGMLGEIGIARELNGCVSRAGDGCRRQLLAKKLHKTRERRERLDRAFSKAYVLGVALFFFGFLLFADAFLLLQMGRGEGGFSFFLFTFVFWGVGIYAFRSHFGRH